MPRNITAATDSILHINLMPAYGVQSLYHHQYGEDVVGKTSCLGINYYRISLKTLGQEQLSNCNNNITIYHKQIQCEGVYHIYLAQDRFQWQTYDTQ